MSAFNYGQWSEKYEHSIKAGFNCYRECWDAAIKFAEENFSSHNTCVMPLPTLDECIYMAVSAYGGEGSFQHDCEIVKKVYEFIGRQQHNT